MTPLRATGRRRVLLINPPARTPVLRDYYCSTRPKARYFWQPIDLLALAALLRNDHDVRLIDAIGARRTETSLLEEAAAFAPHDLFVLASTLTRDADIAFAAKLAQRIHSVTGNTPGVVLGGEVALDPNFDFTAAPFVRGLALDFVTHEVARFVAGGPPAGRVRTPDHAPLAPTAPRRPFTLGSVPHAALGFTSYRLPFWANGFASLLTDFGCPYTCSFCNSGRHSIGFSLRDPDDIAADTAAIAATGVRHVYLRDMTFGAVRDHSLAVLDALSGHNLASRAFTRADRIDATFARAMRRSGFEVAQIGVDLPDESQRHALGKNVTDSEQIAAFRYLNENRIMAGAHFVIGFADDRPDIVAACLRTAAQLRASYCSINLYTNRFGTTSLATSTPGPARAWLGLYASAAMLAYNGASFTASRLAPARPTSRLTATTLRTTGA